MILMGGDLRTHDRELPHVLGLHRAGIPAHVRQRVVAGRADRRIMITHKIDMIGIGGGAVVRRMPRLTAGVAPAWYAHPSRWCGWWVGRWGGGGVLRMLVELGFEVRYALLEVGFGLEELSKLGLLELERQETAADKGTHGGRRGRPGVGGTTRRWRRMVHAGG